MQYSENVYMSTIKSNISLLDNNNISMAVL